MCYIKWQKELQKLTKVIECEREISWIVQKAQTNHLRPKMQTTFSGCGQRDKEGEISERCADWTWCAVLASDEVSKCSEEHGGSHSETGTSGLCLQGKEFWQFEWVCKWILPRAFKKEHGPTDALILVLWDPKQRLAWVVLCSNFPPMETVGL